MKLCGKAVYSIIFVSRGFLKVLKPFILLGSRAFVYLFPLNCACWLGSEVEEYAVDAVYFVCNSVGNVVENRIGNLFDGSCHCVSCVDCSDDCRPTFVTAVIFNANALHIGNCNKVLPYLISKSTIIKFFSQNSVSLTQSV